MPEPELVIDLSALAGRWNRHADLEALVRAVPQVKQGGCAFVGPFHIQRSGNIVEVMPHVPNEPQHGVVKLRRGECLVLPLVLKGRWYRMIESGEKREEYRDLTRYWHERLLRFNRELLHTGKKPVVEFRHGYAADAPRMTFEIVTTGPFGSSAYAILHGRRRGRDRGEPDGYHFSIQLGRRVEWEPEADDDICRHARRSFAGCPYSRDIYCTLEDGPGLPKEKCHFVKQMEQLERKRILDEEDFDE